MRETGATSLPRLLEPRFFGSAFTKNVSVGFDLSECADGIHGAAFVAAMGAAIPAASGLEAALELALGAACPSSSCTLGGVHQAFGRHLPLTPLENVPRHAAGASGYSGGFIEHYLVPTIYPAALSHPVQFLLAGMVVLANAVVYSVVWWRRRSVG